MKNVAVILAGGVGKRMGADVPKQFMPLGDCTVLEHSVRTFGAHPAIGEVVVVAHPDWKHEVERLAATYVAKPIQIVEGGAERYISSLNAIRALDGYIAETNVLLHDAARPLVSSTIIDRVVEALTNHMAVGVAVPSTDTVWQIGEDGDTMHVCAIPNRATMWLAQTPQAFRLGLLREAYTLAMADEPFASTDDCGVVRHYMPEVDIAVVKGEAANLKVTRKEDLQLLQQWI